MALLRPIRSWDDLRDRRENVIFFHSSRTKVWLWFAFTLIGNCLNTYLPRFPFKSFKKELLFTPNATHPNQVPRRPQQGNLWLTLKKVNLYNRIRSSLTNFFFSTHVDSLEMVRRNLAKVTDFYCFLGKNFFFLYDKLIAYSLLCNSTPISRVPTRKKALETASFGSHKNEETKGKIFLACFYGCK